MERVGVNILGLFPVTKSGNSYVLVAMDYFTKWLEANVVPDQSATMMAERLVEAERLNSTVTRVKLRVPGLWCGLPAPGGEQDKDNSSSNPE